MSLRASICARRPSSKVVKTPLVGSKKRNIVIHQHLRDETRSDTHPPHPPLVETRDQMRVFCIYCEPS